MDGAPVSSKDKKKYREGTKRGPGGRRFTRQKDGRVDGRDVGRELRKDRNKDFLLPRF